MTRTASEPVNRETFTTSRRLEFLSVAELEKQSGYTADRWPEVIVKELVDNSLDACEEAGVAPDIEVEIRENAIVVVDNGPGVPATTIAGIVDLDQRVSSRQAYMAPDRGAQGNATKVLVGMPFAICPERPGRLVVESRGLRHEIGVAVDGLSESPTVGLQTNPGVVKTGTRVEVHLPCSLTGTGSPFLQHEWSESVISRLTGLCVAYSLFNPHLTLKVSYPGGSRVFDASAKDWKKWRPSDPTSVHWYSPEKFAALVKRCIASDLAAGKDRPVSQFVAQFDGMSGSRVRKDVLGECGLVRASLSTLAPDGEPDARSIEKVRKAMVSRARTVPAHRLGVIGKDHLQRAAVAAGADAETFRYAKVVHEDGHPGVTEIGFAIREGDERLALYGVNWSAAIRNPFKVSSTYSYDVSVDGILGQRYACETSPIVVVMHHAQVGASYTDRGKGSLSLPAVTSEKIKAAIEKVTASWFKQCKAEEREAKAALRRREALRNRGDCKATIKEVAHEIMPAVYDELSSDGSGGKLPVNARQFMYKARPLILERTGKTEMSDAYFTQQLLPDYINANPDTAGDWDVVYDDRGHFTEPHTKTVVNLGTIDVRKYLSGCRQCTPGMPTVGVSDVGRFPTKGPANRYGGVLFIEKEGFAPLLQRVRLAERYDLAVMSTKGLSNVAARRLIDEVCVTCSDKSLPLFVLHDFDKAGFSILSTLRTSSRRYAYRNAVNVIDLGVRLKDVRHWGLQAEPVIVSRGSGGSSRRDPRDNLRDNGATEEEVAFLVSDRKRTYVRGKPRDVYHGQRVELNAFSPRDFVDWIETGLSAHGVTKVVPNDDALETQYRRAIARHELLKQVRQFEKQIETGAEKADVPATLRRDVEELLRETPSMAWDAAVLVLAENQRR